VPSTLDELDAAAHRIITDGVRRVLIVGGDGTVMTAISAMHRAALGRPLPVFSITHAGTVGTIARSLGMRTPVLKAIEGICGERHPPTFSQPTLALDPPDGRPRIGFIFGAGLVSSFFEEYDGAGGGLGAAAAITARLFVGALLGTRYAKSVLAPTPCRLTVDGKCLGPDAWGVIVCSVLRDVGLHVRVTYRGSEDPRRPHLVATPIGPRELGANFPRVLGGKPIRGAGTFDGLVGEFRLDFDDGPGTFVLDGDTLAGSSVTVRAGPVVEMLRL
jgi:diacylglycerol kinase (ATP)